MDHRLGVRSLVAAVVTALAASAAQAEAPPPGDLTQLKLEDLMNLEVTSVSRRPESLQDATAAIFVITREDIRRSGARSIPELLRLVPGLHVARIGDINTYSVSSRGFADRISDKLEVLVDGRTVYTPLFSGVFWDTLDTFLPDIERIEVIRGPGAALWGTNAFSGVINIVTQDAAATHGTVGYTGAGTEERSEAGVSSGGSIGTGLNARLYAKEYERDGLKDAQRNDTFNVARFRQAGFRGDAALSPASALTVSGDLYQGAREDQFEAPAKSGDAQTSGGNLIARWQLKTGDDSELAVQAYYDHSKRFIPAIVFRETRDIGDLDVQQRLPLGHAQTLVFGAGYRQSHDVTGGPGIAYIFFPADATLNYYSAFLQDQIALGEALELTLGDKFEHNDYTHWESQPTARLGWKASEEVFSWVAVSRAVHTPNRLDHDSGLFIAGFGTFRIGNPGQGTQRVLDYEWGLRWSRPHFSADLATFYDRYNDLRSAEASPPFGIYGNGIEGYGHGAELSLIWQPERDFDARLSYSFQELNLHDKPGSTDGSTVPATNGASPTHQAGLRLAWMPVSEWTTSAFLRYSGRDSRNAPQGAVPAYTELDLRVGWQATRNLELAASGDNLLDRQHGELRSPIGPAYVETPRSALLELIWRWD